MTLEKSKMQTHGVESQTVADSHMYGEWMNFNYMDKKPSFRDVLSYVLEKTPAEVLDAPVTDLKKGYTFSAICKDPYPTYDDPLSMRGFVAWKFVYKT